MNKDLTKGADEMSKTTTFLLAAVSVAIGFMASACTSSTAEQGSASAQIADEWQKKQVGTLGTGLGTHADVYVLTDKDTNIEYIVVVTGIGDTKNSCITPRLTSKP